MADLTTILNTPVSKLLQFARIYWCYWRRHPRDCHSERFGTPGGRRLSSDYIRTHRSSLVHCLKCDTWYLCRNPWIPGEPWKRLTGAQAQVELSRNPQWVRRRWPLR